MIALYFVVDYCFVGEEDDVKVNAWFGPKGKIQMIKKRESIGNSNGLISRIGDLFVFLLLRHCVAAPF